MVYYHERYKKVYNRTYRWCEHASMAREVKPDFYCGYGEE